MSRTTAIILNRDGESFTRRAIESLLRASNPPAIVVVDNGSTDPGEAATLARRFPSIVVIPLAANVGFARAVNVGAKLAIERGAEYVLLFNNDAWLLPRSRTIERLEAALDADPALAAAGPQILNSNGSTQSIGYRYSLWWPLARSCTSIAQRPRFLGKSCLLLRAATFSSLGGLDSDYFAGADELDYALRLEERSRGVAFVSGATVLQRRGTSNRHFSPSYSYAVLRDSLTVLRKHCRPIQRPTALATLAAVSFAHAVLGLRNGHLRTPIAVMRAWVEFVPHARRPHSGHARSAQVSAP